MKYKAYYENWDKCKDTVSEVLRKYNADISEMFFNKKILRGINFIELEPRIYKDKHGGRCSKFEGKFICCACGLFPIGGEYIVKHFKDNHEDIVNELEPIRCGSILYSKELRPSVSFFTNAVSIFFGYEILDGPNPEYSESEYAEQLLLKRYNVKKSNNTPISKQKLITSNVSRYKLSQTINEWIDRHPAIIFDDILVKRNKSGNYAIFYIEKD